MKALVIDKEPLIDLYVNQKLTMKETAERLGIAVGSVYNYLHRFNIEIRPNFTPETRAKMSLAQKGKTSPMKGRKHSAETILKMSLAQKGKFKHKTEFGGHVKHRDDGYIYIYAPDHPYATKDGYVMEHILMMEHHIGRYIDRSEVVHHINGIRNDNRIENLKLMTFKEHSGYHMKQRWIKKKGEKENVQ